MQVRSQEAEAKRKVVNDEYYGRIREEIAKWKDRTTAAQLKYLTRLVERLGKERFDAKCVVGT
ncbi:hypothetical protein ACFC4G_05850 [Streptomyces sp. NPDC056002]|uniref:hypothetical protein n=1 Tax=Streptomyces sp. NPDC056002 TaxID=3345675 RepID=UPI0035DE9433